MTEGKDPVTGHFLPGNDLWKRGSPGGPRAFPTAEDLEVACVGYFEWAKATPLLEAQAFAYQGAVTIESLPKMRALTIEAMCLHIGIARRTWYAWREVNREDFRPDLTDVMEWAEGVIYAQQYEGAAAGLLNAAIVARKLGLAEKQELTGKDGGPIRTTTLDTSKLSTEALTELLAARDADAHE